MQNCVPIEFKGQEINLNSVTSMLTKGTLPLEGGTEADGNRLIHVDEISSHPPQCDSHQPRPGPTRCWYSPGERTEGTLLATAAERKIHWNSSGSTSIEEVILLLPSPVEEST